MSSKTGPRQHRHKEGRSHRMPGHRGKSHYGYGHNSSKSYHSTGSKHGKMYHKMKYYSNVTESSSKRGLKSHRSSSNRHSNRGGYVGHGHYSSNNSQSGSNYHQASKAKPCLVCQAIARLTKWKPWQITWGTGRRWRSIRSICYQYTNTEGESIRSI